MLVPQNIGHFDVRFDIKSPTNDDTGPNRITTFSTTTYADVFGKEVKALGSEKDGENQIVSTEKRAWVIRKLDRVVTVTMAVSYDSELWHITSVHPYGSDRRHIVLECERFDND